ncbi:hypothetical protein, partial [Streptococcus pneumoniae]|uniref:hypothetical protein n=1 Tax=Streptococcus pneumoniae TaxID=1313 RepID=UPI0012593EF9
MSEQGAWPRVELTGAEAGVPVLGYTVEYGRLMAALAERLQATRALLYLPGVGEPRIEACHDGVWPLLREVSPIRVVHVSEQGAWPRVELTGAEAGVPVLGYTV